MIIESAGYPTLHERLLKRREALKKEVADVEQILAYIESTPGFVSMYEVINRCGY